MESKPAQVSTEQINTSDALIKAREWIGLLYDGDFKGRRGIEDVLAFLIQRGACCEEKMKDAYPGLTIRVEVPGVSGTPPRVFAIHHRVRTSGKKEFTIPFKNFRERVDQGTLDEMNLRLRSVPGLINEMNRVRDEKQFNAMLRAEIGSVLHNESSVSSVIDALTVLLDAQWRK